MRVDLKKTLFILPNLFTLSSVFCGFYAIIVCTAPGGVVPGMGDAASAGAQEEAFYRAALLIVFAMFFDTIDGRVARLTKTQSAFGVQIDSLADVVSFGIAPAVLVYRWSLYELGLGGVAACFAFAACGVIRLARFNVLAMNTTGAPKKPGKYIAGLPIPGAAGIVVSVVVANFAVTGSIEDDAQLVLALMIGLSFLMVSTIKFRSFKDVKLNWRTGLFVLTAVGSTAAIAIMFHPSFALVWLLAGYVVIGVLETAFDLSRRAARLATRRGAPPEPSEAEEPEEGRTSSAP